TGNRQEKGRTQPLTRARDYPNRGDSAREPDDRALQLPDDLEDRGRNDRSRGVLPPEGAAREALEPGLLLRTRGRGLKLAVEIGRLTGIEGEGVRERVDGGALGRGDVDRGIVVVRVRGRDDGRAAADREDVAAAEARPGQDGGRPRSE